MRPWLAERGTCAATLMQPFLVSFSVRILPTTLIIKKSDESLRVRTGLRDRALVRHDADGLVGS